MTFSWSKMFFIRKVNPQTLGFFINFLIFPKEETPREINHPWYTHIMSPFPKYYFTTCVTEFQYSFLFDIFSPLQSTSKCYLNIIQMGVFIHKLSVSSNFYKVYIFILKFPNHPTFTINTNILSFNPV